MKSMLLSVLIVLGMFSAAFAENPADKPQESSLFMADTQICRRRA